MKNTDILAKVMRKLEADAAAGAAKICNTSCPMHANACDLEHVPSSLPPINPDFKCPLARFSAPHKPETRKWYEIPFDERMADEDELFALCATCEHGHLTYNKVSDELQVSRRDYETACLDCPVWSCLEVLDEARAEAACS